MGYYDGDPFSGHELNEVKCAECEEYFDDQEREGNICPPCVTKGYGEGESLQERADRTNPYLLTTKKEGESKWIATIFG